MEEEKNVIGGNSMVDDVCVMISISYMELEWYDKSL